MSAAPRVPTLKPLLSPAHSGPSLQCNNFFVQCLAYYLHTIAQNINFRTVTSIADSKLLTLIRKGRAAIQLYHTHGLVVRNLHSGGHQI